MSQPEIQDPERGRHMADDYPNKRPLSSSRQSQVETNIGDSSGPFFAMYTSLTVEEDHKMAERWQKDAEGVLIFTGLFSAIVTALTVVSLQDITPNPQDNCSIYLEKLYRLQAERNVCHISVAPVEVQPPAFSPPLYAVWANALWFLSLVISLTCATLATLLQQWARLYIKITQLPRRTPERRAQIRGVERFHVAWAVWALHALVHLSLFVFFAGLLVFLFNINHTVCSAVVCWVALSSTVYACITFMPIFWHDSPYYTPLSSTVWLLYTTTTRVLAIPKFIRFRHHPIIPTWRCLCKSVDHYRGWILGGIERAAEETTSDASTPDTPGEVLDHQSSYPYFYSCHVSDPAEKGGHAGDPMLTTSPASLSHDDDPAEARIAVTPPTAYDTTSFPINDPDSTIPHNGDEPSLISELSNITTALPPSRSLTPRSCGGSPLP